VPTPKRSFKKEKVRLGEGLEHLDRAKAKPKTSLSEQVAQLKIDLDKQERLFMSREKSYLKELEAKQAELDRVYMLHVKSVNSVDTGLEPISDDKLEERFGGVRGEV
jgi:hypothetical protein